MHCIRMGKFCSKSILPSGLFYLLLFYKVNKRYHVCHDGFMKFKMNRYHSKSDEIHVGLGVT